MTRYKIYTENKRLPMLRTVIKKYFNAVTETHGIGLWKGKSEKSVVFEIIGPSHLEPKVLAVAGIFKCENKQTAVLVTRELIEEVLI